MTMPTVSAEGVRRFRFRRHQLDRVPARGGNDVVALWRPRTSGRRLRLAVEPWSRLTKPIRTALEEQAERLTAHRGVTLAGITVD